MNTSILASDPAFLAPLSPCRFLAASSAGSTLEALFQNDNVVRYLTRNLGEIFEELRKVVDTTKTLSEAADSAEQAVA